MDDKKIKSLIKEYKNKKRDIKDILEIISDLIINFPKIGFSNFDEDLCSDFYLYVVERLPKIIENYNEKESATFKTFLFLVLRRHYLNFIKKFKRENFYNNKKIDEFTLKTVFYEDNSEIKLAAKDVIRLFSLLDTKSRLLLKLRFPQFLVSQDFFEIAREFNIDSIDLLDNLDIIMDSDVPVPPRLIARFLNMDVKKISKMLFNINDKIRNLFGENYASF
ncbi:MAG TPA: hypothetical protein PKW55_03245 [Spirochaetota bacterium]|nr:hypothetical protein [Spirochaetota bacterium]HOM39241.1 hypothetical protein [Spirochaetota bacterium]HPQ48648.1 hypothetical protein [Spirochaetota bacterium]